MGKASVLCDRLRKASADKHVVGNHALAKLLEEAADELDLLAGLNRQQDLYIGDLKQRLSDSR